MLSMKLKKKGITQMKKFLLVVCAVVAITLTGCKSMPTPAQGEEAAYAIGASTALVCNMTKIDDKDRQIIIDIVNEISYCMPTQGQTIVEAWTKVAEDHVAKLIAKGQITEVESKLILKIFDTVANSADYMIRVRWPEIGKYSDLVLAITHGFCDGFLAYFEPANIQNGFSVSKSYRLYDEDAFNYLISIKSPCCSCYK